MENVYQIIELFGMVFQGTMYAAIAYGIFRASVAVRNYNKVAKTASRYINKRRQGNDMSVFSTVDCKAGTQVLCAICKKEITLIAMRGDCPEHRVVIDDCLNSVLIHSLYTRHAGECYGEPCEGRRQPIPYTLPTTRPLS